MAKYVSVLSKTTLLDFARHLCNNFYPEATDLSDPRVYVSTEERPEVARLPVGPLPDLRLPEEYHSLSKTLREVMTRLFTGNLDLVDDEPPGCVQWVVEKDDDGEDACAVAHRIDSSRVTDLRTSRMYGFQASSPSYILRGNSIYDGRLDVPKIKGLKEVARIKRGVVELSHPDPDLEFLITALSDSSLGTHVLPFRLAKKSK